MGNSPAVALGAFKFKQDAGKPAGSQKVSSVPEVYEWEAQRGDWLLVGCDGIWDTLSNERAVDEVCKADHSADLGDIVAKFLETCIQKEADDNLTLMAIELGSVAEEPRTVTVSPGNFLKVKDKEVIDQYVAFCLRFGHALKKEMVLKAPPRAALEAVAAVPAPGRYSSLPAPKGKEQKVEEQNGKKPSVAPAAPASGKAVEQNGKTPSVAAAAPASGKTLPPLVIVGPSGVGKGTLIKALTQAFPGVFGFAISHTTRPMRPGEVDGKDYHFTELETMKKDVEDGKFIEYAVVHTNMYGTSFATVDDVQKRGQVCILDIDVQGAKSVHASSYIEAAKFLFVRPPSVDDLEKRLRGRGTETEDKIQTRLRNAVGELEFCESSDFLDHVLVNDDLGRAKRELFTLVRSWYPFLVQQMKVTTKRSVQVYAKAARESLTAEGAANELQVMALGNATSIAVSVASKLVEEGHVLVQTETGLKVVHSDALGKTVQTPQFSAIFRRCVNGS